MFLTHIIAGDGALSISVAIQNYSYSLHISTGISRPPLVHRSRASDAECAASLLEPMHECLSTLAENRLPDITHVKPAW